MEENRCTLSGEPPDEEYVAQNAGAPQPIDPKTGMHKDYWVICESERLKGFVRPVRDTYRHVGVRPTHPLRDLTPAEHEQYDEYGYVKFEAYAPAEQRGLGKFWTKKQLNSGCGTTTRMGNALAETYARDPKFYGATFCCHCGTHLRVGEDGEFVWEDGSRVGT